MKLSNKVLIAFFGLLFLYLTAVFAEIRLRGTPNIIDDANSIAETVDIEGIAYLVLRDMDQRVNVIGSDHPRVEIRSLSGDLLQRLKYKISGDTLTLAAFQVDDTQTIKISLFVPKTGLKGITIDKAMASVSGLEQDSLRILQRGGRLYLSNSEIGKIHTDGSAGSYLGISDTGLDILSANIEESEVLISSPLTLLEGSMRNKSFLRVNHVGEIQFRKDESSRLHMYP